jgi:hypothetical protein
MKKALKIIRKIFVTAVVLTVIAGIAAVVLARVYEDDLKEYVIKKIDEKFSADINVEKIELSFWRKFPNASLRFKNIAVRDSHIPENPPVFAARNLFLQFDIYDILHRKFILKKAEAEGGKIDILIYKSGKNNFDLFRNESDDTSGFFLSMQDFRIRNMELSFENQGSVQSYNLKIEDISLPFKLTGEGFESGVKGKLKIVSYRGEGVELIKNRNILINAGLGFNTGSQKLSFTQSEIMVDGIRIKLKGDFDFSRDNVFTVLQISTPELNLKKLVAALPANVSTALKTYKLKGEIKTDITIDGQLGGKKLPAINASFLLNNASLESKEAGLYVNNLSFSGSFTNGRRHSLTTSVLTLKTVNGKVNGESFNGSITISNFINARIKARLHSQTNLLSVKKMAKLTAFDILEGGMTLDVGLTAAVDNFLSNPAFDFKIKGNAVLDNAKLKFKDNTVVYSNITGKVGFTTNRLDLNGIKLVSNGTHLNIKAAVDNYLSLSGNGDGPVSARAIITADEISMKKIMQIIDFPQPDDGNPVEFITTIDFSTKKFIWDDISLSNATGSFSYRDDRWSLSGLNFGFAGGVISGNLNRIPGAGGFSVYNMSGDYKNINIKKTFGIFDNFGQDVIKAENIEGTASGIFKISLKFDAENNIVRNAINANTSIKIVNGRLVGIKELNELSSYTRIDDFSDIKFSTLTNTITVSNGKIVIPKMNILTDKMDMDVFGTHSFSNEYTYHLSVLLADVLGRKVKKTPENEFGIVNDEDYGKIRLFLVISGKGDDFKVKYDRKETAAQVKKDIKEEGEDLKKVLKEEFTNSRRDSIRKAKRRKKEKEKQQLKLQEEGKFIIEWDDDEDTASAEPQLP